MRSLAARCVPSSFVKPFLTTSDRALAFSSLLSMI